MASSNQIHQAIVIATKTTTIGGRHRPAALVNVGGVTLLKRALLSLVKEGVNRFAVVVADYAVRDKVGCDPKIAALDVSWVLNDERPDEDGYSVFSAGAQMVGDFIIVPADRVFDPKIAKQLLQRRCDGVTLAVANSSVLEPLAFLGSLRFTGLAIGDRELLDALAVREAKAQPMPLTPVLGELAVRNELAVVDVGEAYCQPVVDKRSRGKADALLIGSLRKSVDGVVARHVNRVFSLAVTRLIKNTPIRPNHVTAFSLGVSLLAAYLAARSTAAHPGGLVVGALLWQLASMLDGVDGELARLKFAGSKLGEWFDTLTDDIGKFAFFMGSGIGAAAVFGSQIWFGIMALAVTIQVGTSLTVYRKLLQTGSGSHYALTWDGGAAGTGTGEGNAPKSLWNRMTGRLHFLSRRDSLVAIWLGMAVVGLLKLAIVLTLIVTVCVLLNEFFNPRQVRAGFVTSPQRKATNTQPVRSAM